ncbi:methyltransferase-like protein 13 [Histomonas meleagridis]|uniref:methyltransferase-like protein 13 n=1 Tax=Histomonas meleagridis TaxID=135588 RepID=UPI0035594664|nr:methyltransferase-like protein 13 [Histomonas meleagridis]KAH0801092.1 methyltransferase-like protein 13 [Histomonas meleagridis]
MESEVFPRDYSSAEYWESRYKEESGTFDWYFGWNDVFQKNLFSLNIKGPILVVGCGNSLISYNLEKFGIYPVISTDISHTCVQKMQKEFNGCYLPMDVCDLQFKDNLFPCVIDKGTLDAILCTHDFELPMSKMMLEISRVLAPNGVFIEITFGKTAEKLNILDSPDLLNWTLEKKIDIVSGKGTANMFVFRKFKEVVIVDDNGNEYFSKDWNVKM